MYHSTLHWKEIGPWAIGGILLLIMLWLLAPVLTPFVLGAGLAYLGDPLVLWLQKKKLSRTSAVVLVFSVLSLSGLLFLLLMIPLLQKQAIALMQQIPEWLHWLQEVALPKLGVVLPADVQLDVAGLKSLLATHSDQAGGIAAQVWKSVSSSGAALLGAFATLMLIPIVTFYLMRDWPLLLAWFRTMIPPRLLPTASGLAQETDAVLGGFIRGQLLVMAALATLYSIGLALTGLKLALAIGLLAGLVSFVPYLGFIVGIAAASLAVLVQTQELMPLLWVALVFGIGQVVESMFLTPTLVGDKIGLHPVTVMFAIMAGGQLFGFTGVLLALPAAAVIAVLLRRARQQWLQSALYLHAAPPPPPPPEPPAAT